MATSRRQEPILVAVIGVTGAGKSTFINKATGACLPTSRELRGCKRISSSIRNDPK
jgi:ABC-type uncharacterized transport system ATPase component